MIKSNYSHHEKQVLSTFWHHLYKSGINKISFFGKGITFVDKLYQVPQDTLTQIRQIDLSHNALSRLDNIKQFKNLQTLNISHNYLIDGRSLLKLKSLTKLHTLYVKGNPFVTSKQGEEEAIGFLITKTTDIQIFNRQCTFLLDEMIDIFRRIEINKNLENRTILHVEFRKEYEHRLIEEGLQTLDQQINLHNRNNKNSRNMTLQLIFQQKLLENKEQINKVVRMSLLRKIFEDQVNLNSLQNLEEVFSRQKQVLQDQLNSFAQKLFNSQTLLQNTLKNVERRQRSKQKLKNFIKPRDTNSPVKLFKVQDDPIRRKSPTKQNVEKGQPKYVQFQRKIASKQEKKKKQTQEEKFETFYSNMLRKYSPIYHLLYSPLQSLKNTEKDLLIQTLSTHLREKSYQLFRNEKIKGEMILLKQQFDEKEKDLQFAQKKFNEYKIAMNEQLDLLSQQNQKMLARISLLQSENSEKYQLNQAFMEKMNNLTEECSEMKLINIKQNSRIQNYEQCEKLQEVIANKRQKRLKCEYLRELIRGGQLYEKIKKLKTKKEADNNKKLTNSVFSQWKYETKIEKTSAQMQKSLQDKTYKHFYSSLTNFSNFNKKSKQLKKIRLNSLIHNFLTTLAEFKYKSEKEQAIVTKIHNAIKNKRMRLVLNSWVSQAKQEIANTKEEQVAQWYKLKLQQKYFKQWLILERQALYKEVQVSMNHKSNRVHTFLRSLQDFSFTSKSLNEKFLNLIVFLHQHKRNIYYNKFKKYTLSKLEEIKTKEKLIELETKTKSFIEFCGVSLHHLKRKKDQQQKNRMLADMIRKNTIQNLKDRGFKKKSSNFALRNLFELGKKKYRYDDYRVSIKQFGLQDYYRKKLIRSFYGNMKEWSYERRKLDNKKKNLSYILEKGLYRKLTQFGYLKHFFIELKQPSLHKSKLTQFLAKKYFRMMEKSFVEWKIQNYKEQLQGWREKLLSLGTEIDDIQSRHLNVHEQKQVLIAIIEQREKEIRSLNKKLEEAEYTIHAKQDKYQKLKELYVINEQNTFGTHQSISISGRLGNYGELKESRIPQRDYETLYESQKKEPAFLAHFSKF